MKVYILSKNIDLLKMLERKTDLDITPINEVELNDQDFFVLSDREISFNKLLAIIETKINYNITYILSDHYEYAEIKNIISIAKSKKIKVLPPNLTESQIVNKIVKNIDPNLVNLTKIITFLGADSKVGTTMITQCIAEKFSANTSLKTALLFLNDSKGTYYIDRNISFGLDNVRTKLSNDILSHSDILDICCPVSENLYIIPGPQNILSLRHYYPEDIEVFIEKLSNIFDLLFIDGGSKFDSGLSVAALNSTVHKILITTQQGNAIKNYERYSNQLFDLMDINIKEFTLIVNKYVNSNYLLSKSELSRVYRMFCLGTLPNLGMVGWKAETNNKSLNSFKNDFFDSKLEAICKILAEKININYSLERSNSRFLNKLKRFI